MMFGRSIIAAAKTRLITAAKTTNVVLETKSQQICFWSSLVIIFSSGYHLYMIEHKT